MNMKKNKTIMAVMAALALASSSAAGCGAKQAENKQEQASEQGSGNQASIDTSKEGADSAKDSGEGEKTEVRREDYPDCDGSGHGYREIYYSDGSMETEEY